jgi:hypothetical protein
MANALGTLFGDIASAIREKTGDTATMKPAEFPEKIAAIEAGGGGASLPPGVYWKQDVQPPKSYNCVFFEHSDELFVLQRAASGSGQEYVLSKYLNGTWTTVISTYKFNSTVYDRNVVNFNGKVHFFVYKNHYTYNSGTTFNSHTNIPNSTENGCFTVHNGTIKFYCYSDGKLYAWDEGSDTWTMEASIASAYQLWRPFVIGGILYFAYDKSVYKYDNGSTTKIATLPVTFNSKHAVYKDKVYFASDYDLYMFDPITNTCPMIGKTPFTIATFNLNVLSGEVHLFGGDDKYRANMVMHEVTE